MARGLRSNRHNLTTRQITAPATGPAPDTSGPTGTVPLASITSADDLKAIEALAGTSAFLVKTGANTWALRTLTLSAAFEALFGITNPAGVAGDPQFTLDTQAANVLLAGPTSGGDASPTFRALVAADIGTTLVVQFARVGVGVAADATRAITHADTVLLRTTVGFGNGAAASIGTLTNAPAAGDPTKWIPVDDAGTTRYIPAW